MPKAGLPTTTLVLLCETPEIGSLSNLNRVANRDVAAARNFKPLIKSLGGACNFLTNRARFQGESDSKKVPRIRPSGTFAEKTFAGNGPRALE
ncbi:MAG: hypothetical protein WAO61_00875 [Solirubrobacterales bacterium]